MTASVAADTLLVNGRVVAFGAGGLGLPADAAAPADAIAVRAGRILAVGRADALRALAGAGTRIVDAGGGVIAPAFHDAHLHLLSYARAAARVDCRVHGSIAEIRAALRERAATLPPSAWVRAVGYDDARLSERRHPDRHDLDAAVPDRPVRLQHRTMHLDVLNTPALRLLGLFDAGAPQIERDEAGAPTGRLYQAAALLHGRLPRPSPAELAADVRRACRQLLAWGVTTVQDATPTNDADAWALFHSLKAQGALPQRLFLLPGEAAWPTAHQWATDVTMAHQRDADVATAHARAADTATPPNDAAGIALGPVKLLVDEATTDPAALAATVAAVRASGRAIALHAVSDAEVAVALATLQAAGPRAPDRVTGWAPGGGPDRIEHGALLPDALLPDLQAAGVTVVGQPSLLHARGDAFLRDHPAEQHDWLYRVRSLAHHGIPYAASSDAPLTRPNPARVFVALRTRRTAGGAVLGPNEALEPLAALAALTLEPARAVGAEGRLGALRPGWLADLVVLDPHWLDAHDPQPDAAPVRMTILAGRVVWASPAALPGLTPAMIPEDAYV